MVGNAKMRRLHKRKKAQETTLASKVSHVRDRVSTQVSPELCQAALNQCDETEEPENEYHSPSSPKEVVQEDAPASQDSAANPIRLKKPRGPTKMKDIAVETEDIIHVDFTDKGEPSGPGSVALSSFLGPLVQEHVPVALEDWRKLGDDFKVVLWESIQIIMYKLQARFDLKEEWQKADVFKLMGCLWRASKSRLVSQIQEAKNKEE